RRKLADGTDAHTIHKQLRITGRDVETHTAHLRLIKRARRRRHIGVRTLVGRVVVVRVVRVVRIVRVGGVVVIRVVERVRIRERVTGPQAEPKVHERVEPVVRVKEMHGSDKWMPAYEGSVVDEVATVHNEIATVHNAAAYERTAMHDAKPPSADHGARAHHSQSSMT